MYKSLLLTFAFFCVLPSYLYASDYYGTIQYTEISMGITFIVFQEAGKDIDLCHALNKNFVRGLHTTCSTCVVELQGCDTKLPSAYKNIFDDKPMAFPYISAPYMRIAVFGSSDAISVCRQRAGILQKGMNKEVHCIH